VSERVKPRKLKGFRDYPPELMVPRQHLMDKMRKQAALLGFQPIDTPALEYCETLLGQGGGDTDKEVYRFQDHGEREVALRFDLTVPFARFVAEHQGTMQLPFKKLQIGPVWRGEKPQKGRYREFYQCDLDIIGVDSEAADIEILGAFQSILSDMDVGPFTMRIGNRGMLSHVIKECMPSVDEAGTKAVLIAIDKLEKIGTDKVVNLMVENITGATEGGARLLIKKVTGNPFEAVPADQPDLQRFKSTIDCLNKMADISGKGTIKADLSIARGLAYYTGVVFETVLDDLPNFGSICSGGRYNDLASRFSSRELPGVGGSIGLDRLLACLEELKRLPDFSRPGVYVAIASDDGRAYGFEIATILRNAGIATDIGLQKKLNKQFNYADKAGAKFVITVGGSEVESQTYSLKVLGTGEEQRDLPFSGLVEKIKGL
jgi:histidyl-tRNA synthetase